MSEWIYLSHFLSEKTPAYGGKAEQFTRTETKCMHKGDSCNQFHFSMNNHHGTHIDLPSHFDEKGKRLQDYPATYWSMEKAFCLDVKVGKSELLTSTLVKNVPADVECLFFKTHFEDYRAEKTYWEENPGLSEELGFYLKKHFKKLKMIGVDFISATAYQQRSEGKKAHLAFLTAEQGEAIMIIEDVSLKNISAGALAHVIVSPLLIEGADGGPVTILAKQ